MKCYYLFLSLNADSFTPLDVALLKGHTEISKLLLFHGAVENLACKSLNSLFFYLLWLQFSFKDSRGSQLVC